MLASKDELLALEEGFWTGDEAFFKANADKECLVAFPEMAETMSNADLAATARKPNRWKDLEIEPKGFVEPGSDIVMLTYEARATRATGEPYAALVSTGYVRRADGWKMMFHSQTPLKSAGARKKAPEARKAQEPRKAPEPKKAAANRAGAREADAKEAAGRKTGAKKTR